MMIFIIGGSGSGKSAYAENLAVRLAKKQEALSKINNCNIKKYYLATMNVYDEEGKQKVLRHRKLRSGKGFFTIEQPTGIDKALEKMTEKEKIVLLECLSNLIANEMFSEEEKKTKEELIEMILRHIKQLKEQATHLIIVSNQIFEDGIVYDKTTMEYLDVMGEIHKKLAGFADQIVEVVVGIPIMIKEETT